MGNTEDFRKVLLGKPHIIIGKRRLSESVIKHIFKLLKRYKIIKIKALKSVATKSNIKEIANQVSKSTQSYLLDVRGKTFIISKNEIKKHT